MGSQWYRCTMYGDTVILVNIGVYKLIEFYNLYSNIFMWLFA